MLTAEATARVVRSPDNYIINLLGLNTHRRRNSNLSVRKSWMQQEPG